MPDIEASLDQLRAELPAVESVSLVVSWFGDDLRCGRCTLRPAVEQTVEDGDPMPWRVSGQGRVGREGHEPHRRAAGLRRDACDASVLQAIARLKALGQSVMFYPFILMDIQAGNGLAGSLDRRRRSAARCRGAAGSRSTGRPGRPGSADKTAAAADEVDAFFGAARAVGFPAATATAVSYHGPDEWSYRRFILHYAHLCALAGGVDAFCIGSEMRSLTQIRDGARSYPAVRALRAAGRGRARRSSGRTSRSAMPPTGRSTSGTSRPTGRATCIYHLDPLWAHPDIDFVGIDNYMPLSDWRDGLSHADAAAGSIYDLDYLTRNVAGGEGYRLVLCRRGRARRRRTDCRSATAPTASTGCSATRTWSSWWSRPHVNRLGGVKAAAPTDWVPRSKPIWFTELGCPAVNKGTNQPNVFHDPKSSESFFPYHSNGSRDDFIQYRYLQAMFAHWSDPANNPPSDRYSGRMVDMARAHVWAWDARPWPDFPDRLDTWTDGANHARGHWLNGRTSLAALAEVVAEICARCDLTAIDVGRLHGGVTGYAIEAVESGRQSLQPLMLAYGVRQLRDRRRRSPSRAAGGAAVSAIEPDRCVAVPGQPVVSRIARAAGGGGRPRRGRVRPRRRATTRPGRSEARRAGCRGTEDRADRAAGRAQRRRGADASPGGRCRSPASLGTRCGFRFRRRSCG